MAVYFIQAGESGPIKIGFAEDVSARLRELQCGNHQALTVIRVVDGGRIREAAFHRHFAAQKIRGEWFRFSSEMLSADLLAPPPVKPRAPCSLRGDWPAETVLRLIEAHLLETGDTATAFGRKALGDPNFVRDIRNGREPRRHAVQRALTHIGVAA